MTTLANAAGNLHYVSMCMWHEGREVVPYFDGATAAGSGYTYEWQDAAHASASSRLPVTERAPELFEWRAGVSAIDFLARSCKPTASGSCVTSSDAGRSEASTTSHLAVPSRSATASTSSTPGRTPPATTTRGMTLRSPLQVDRPRRHPAGSRGRLRGHHATHQGPTDRGGRIYPGPGRAQYNVQRAKGRGRTLNLSTVADWSVVVDQNLTATLDGTPIQAGGAVESLEYDLSNDRMRVASRTRDVPAGAIELLTGTIAALSGTIATLT